MNKSSSIVVLFATFALLGCAGKYRTKARTQVLQQAAFDLDCPEKDLNVTLMHDKRIFGALGTRQITYGAKGCARRATYKSQCGPTACTVNNDQQTVAPAQ